MGIYGLCCFPHHREEESTGNHVMLKKKKHIPWLCPEYINKYSSSTVRKLKVKSTEKYNCKSSKIIFTS